MVSAKFRMNSKTCVQDSPPSPVRSTLKIFLPPPAQAYLHVVDQCGFPSSNEDHTHPATSTWSGDSGHRTHFEILLVTWIEWHGALFRRVSPYRHVLYRLSPIPVDRAPVHTWIEALVVRPLVVTLTLLLRHLHPWQPLHVPGTNDSRDDSTHGKPVIPD